MPSRKAVGVAPLITGIWLAFESAGEIVESGLSLWTVPGFVGGCAAIMIGFGVLLEWDSFSQDSTTENRVSTAFLGIAAAAFFVGAAIALA